MVLILVLILVCLICCNLAVQENGKTVKEFYKNMSFTFVMAILAILERLTAKFVVGLLEKKLNGIS